MRNLAREVRGPELTGAEIQGARLIIALMATGTAIIQDDKVLFKLIYTLLQTLKWTNGNFNP